MNTEEIIHEYGRSQTHDERKTMLSNDSNGYECTIMDCTDNSHGNDEDIITLLLEEDTSSAMCGLQRIRSSNKLVEQIQRECE